MQGDAVPLGAARSLMSRFRRRRAVAAVSGSSIASIAIHDAGHGFAALESSYLGGDLRHRFCNPRRSRYVRRDHDRRMMPERMLRGQRLGPKDVEGRATDVTAVDGA